jgi:oxygen-independent coproporphyrinogen-3 oxidase
MVAMAGKSVPRYTSYPTAPHFSSTVGAETYARWLDDAGASGKPVSLYLHVPFCRSICHYCGCTTKASRSDDPIHAYAAVLRDEIALVAARLAAVEISHIHWGGGTPNLLPPDCLDAIVGDLARAFRFSPNMEHAIELDPRHVTHEGALHLKRLGITRASLGVQDVDESVQTAIGRIQPLPVVEAAVSALRAAGIEALNFDLMYGLPLQTPESILMTVRQAVALRPSRIALFGYAHVPWMKPHQRLIDESYLPDIAARLTLARTARDAIREAGFVEIGIDHFARPEDELCHAFASRKLRRNFQGYTTDAAETLIGVGASSIGRTRYGYVQNASDNAGWARAVAAGRLPVVRGKKFEADDLLRARIIEEILCYFEIDLARHAAESGHPLSLFDDDLERLEPLVREGWVSVGEGRVTIERHRHEIARIAAACFDSYLGKAGRHSVAV